MAMRLSRRQFLTALSLAGLPDFAAASPARAATEAPETTTLRLAKARSICVAPAEVADELLRAEGFTEIRYVPLEPGDNAPEAIGRGAIDFGANYSPVLIAGLDQGVPVTAVAPVNVGCFEVFGTDGIRSIGDLKGKRVGVDALGSPGHLFLSLIAANVGVAPGKDIHWVATGEVKPSQLFIDGKIDAMIAFPPEAQELRAQQIGHVLVNAALDRPWSQYFCCMLIGNRRFVANYPVATKRVVRAVLKAADLCTTDPTRVARRLVDGGFTDRYDYAVQALGELPYDKWREYDPEDAVRFYAVRAYEAGMTKSSPQKIIAGGTDWRFFNELKRELKA